MYPFVTHILLIRGKVHLLSPAGPRWLRGSVWEMRWAAPGPKPSWASERHKHSSLIIPRKFHSAQQPKKLRIIHGQPRAHSAFSFSKLTLLPGLGASGAGRAERTIWLQETVEPVQALAKSLEVHILNDKFKRDSQKHGMLHACECGHKKVW